MVLRAPTNPGRVKSFYLYLCTKFSVLFQAMRPTKSLTHWVPGAIFLEVKQLKRETGHSSPCAEVKKTWVSKSTL
jgi:hypothetical protein